MKRLTEKQSGEYILPYDGKNLLNVSTSSNTVMIDDFKWETAPHVTCLSGKFIDRLGELEDVLEKYGIKNAERLDKFIYHKDCQIKKWKQDYENCSKLEKSMSKEHQYCLDNWRACESELAELKQKAIVPKFQIGQEVWVNDWTGQLRIGRIYEVQTNSVLHDQQLLITYLVDFYGNYEDDDQENDYYEEKDIFATKEEAEKKLTEIKGEKDE